MVVSREAGWLSGDVTGDLRDLEQVAGVAGVEEGDVASGWDPARIRSSAPLALRLAPLNTVRTERLFAAGVILDALRRGRSSAGGAQHRRMSRTSDCRRAVGHHKSAHFDINDEKYSFNCAPTATRTRDLLLGRQSRDAA
jgi:hypothetical protein